MENQVRELFRDIAGDIPPQREVPPTLRPRARRRIAATVGVTAVVVGALALGSVVAVRSMSAPPSRPANPRPTIAPAPAAPGSLAYALDGDIYVADPDGSNPVRIAHPRSTEECPDLGYWSEGEMWSPDGRYLAFRSSDCSGGMAPPEGEGVVISDAEGNVLAKFPTGRGWEIRWSPDSTRVAVWDDFDKTIGVYGPDGVRQTQLTVPPGSAEGELDPHWMPDGTALVVFGSAGATELPLDGGAPRPAPRSFYDDDPRVYSPDGLRVAYVDHRTLTIAQPAAHATREVFGNWVGGPSWSPTGDRIAITAKSRGGSSAPIELRVLDVATSSMTVVTEGEIGSELGVVGFTSQGDRILFTTGGDTGWSLWSIGVDGSDPRLIVDGTDGNFYRVPWSQEMGGG